MIAFEWTGLCEARGPITAAGDRGRIAGVPITGRHSSGVCGPCWRARVVEVRLPDGAVAYVARVFVRDPERGQRTRIAAAPELFASEDAATAWCTEVLRTYLAPAVTAAAAVLDAQIAERRTMSETPGLSPEAQSYYLGQVAVLGIARRAIAGAPS